MDEIKRMIVFFFSKHLRQFRLLGSSVVFLLGSSVALGHSVETPDVKGNVGRFSSIALNGDGYPVVAYHDFSNRSLKLLRCNTPSCEGEQSDNIQVLDSSRMVGTYNSLALDKTGSPVISYYDSFNGRLKVLRCKTPKCASINIEVPDTSENIVGQYASLVLDPAGNPVVSYYDASEGDLKVLHCDNPKCSGDQSHNIATPDSQGDVGLYTSLALDDSGNPVVSYYAAKQGLKVLRCDDPFCGGDESGNISNPDMGQVGWYSSLVLDALGHPIVSYQDFFNSHLKVLQCDDLMCAGDESNNISSFGADSAEGAYLSMRLDSLGCPIMSSYDAENETLKLRFFKSSKCKSDLDRVVTPVKVKTQNTGGLYTSLALDNKGYPVVSYYDASNGDLKILRCVTRDCE